MYYFGRFTPLVLCIVSLLIGVKSHAQDRGEIWSKNMELIDIIAGQPGGSENFPVPQGF